jgi:3-deoxy-D-manno-octulosonic-acid transferase
MAIPNYRTYFFSKSGYEVRKSYALANWIGYMPLDTESNAREFIQAIQPSLVIFVKYEFCSTI